MGWIIGENMVQRLSSKNLRSSTDFNFGMPIEKKNSKGIEIDRQLQLPRFIASTTEIRLTLR